MKQVYFSFFILLILGASCTKKKAAADFNLLQNNIPVPEGLIFTTVLTNNGEILALKHPDFFETEEDQVVYYKLKLIDE